MATLTLTLTPTPALTRTRSRSLRNADKAKDSRCWFRPRMRRQECRLQWTTCPKLHTRAQCCLLGFVVFVVFIGVVSVVVLPEFLLRNKISERVPRTPSWPAPSQEAVDCKLQVAPCHAAAESNAKRMCTKWHKINAKIRGNNKNNTSSSSRRWSEGRSSRWSTGRSKRRSRRRNNEDIVFPGEASRQRQLNSRRRICLPPENKKEKKNEKQRKSAEEPEKTNSSFKDCSKSRRIL